MKTATVPNKSLTKLYRGKYNVCHKGKCFMKSTTFKQLIEPTKGRLYNKVCVECDKPITTKSFARLPVSFWKNVQHPNAYSDDDDNQLPCCERVVCGDCSLPKEKQTQTQ